MVIAVGVSEFLLMRNARLSLLVILVIACPNMLKLMITLCTAFVIASALLLCSLFVLLRVFRSCLILTAVMMC